MSASDKKKLRKEQQSAAMTEKQRNEKKEQKKLKAYTVTFVIAMVLVASIVLVSVLSTPVQNLMMSSTTSLTVNDHKIDAVEFNYFYKDYISDFYDQFSSGGDYQDLYVQIYTGLNPAQSLDSQTYNSETGKTWADYFTANTVNSVKLTYAIYDAAKAEGYQLPEDTQKNLDAAEDSIDLAAKYLGYSNGDAYLRAIYGSSASMKSYLAYYEVCTIASAYSSAYVDALDFSDEDFRTFEQDKLHEYNSYTYAYYYLKADSYLTGGTTTTGEDGKETTTYSDDEKQAAVEAALADAKALAVSENSTVDLLNTAIQALNENTKSATASEATAVLYGNLPTIEGMADWLSSEDRASGDITYIPYTTHTHADGEEHSDDEDSSEYETVNGYYVVLYLESTDNTMNIGSVRHLLVMFENDDGETYSDGITEFTDEQKAAAKEEAEKILEEFKGGDMSEDAFIALLTLYTDDVDDTTKKPNNDGLYSSITPDSGYVKSFSDWACADHEEGDVEIIESDYGYHIMYYVGAEELNYRDTLINEDMISEAYTEWQDGLLEKTVVTEGNLKYVDTDYVISQ